MTRRAVDAMARKKAGRAEITPRNLEAKVNAYFAECEALDVFPDRADMIVYLGLQPRLFCIYESNENSAYTPYADILEYARLRREGWLSRVMFSDKNKAQSAIFQLRQPLNGGYSDKQEQPGELRVRLDIGGGGRELLD